MKPSFLFAVRRPKRTGLWLSLLAAISVVVPSAVLAHGGSKHITLHVNPRWSECSFQIDPALTQQAFRQFAQEGGLVTYFRPLIDARPMGAGNYEFSILQWQTAINDADAAWNDTFVHPDSTHWLYEGSGLAFPGLSFRAGVTDQFDMGVYFTKNPGANYGFLGGQVQYNVSNGAENAMSASVRGSFVTLFGPEDLGLWVAGLDLVASKRYEVWSGRIVLSPYAGVSTYLSSAHETSPVVDLKDERVIGAQAMVGAVAEISMFRVSAEYNVARVNSTSFKLGVVF
jgi:hypothetical protein